MAAARQLLQGIPAIVMGFGIVGQKLQGCVEVVKRCFGLLEGKPRDAWAPRTDVNGEVLWRVQLVALGDGEAEIIRVAVPGDPKVGQGEMVSVDGLTAQAWELDGRSGMAFRAHAVRSVPGRSSSGSGEKTAA